MPKCVLAVFVSLCIFSLAGRAQDPTASIEGVVTDASGLPVPGAEVTITAAATSRSQSQVTAQDGHYSFLALPAGEYDVAVSAKDFAPHRARLRLSVNQVLSLTSRLDVAAHTEVVQVEAAGSEVHTKSNVLGSVITGREAVELPLNGRNFAQLGLLQVGVLPMTAGVTAHGGSRRSGHAYAVNGQRPESNNYLVDGTHVVNRIDGGYALKMPVDAIEEFKILTHAASAEYGGTSGGNTTIVTRSGGNEFHGTAYEFLRNDRFDGRNFFAAETEPLKQNQFEATLGGPLRRNKLFLFSYYEGFRNRQGITRGATVPSLKQREGDFSESAAPLRDISTGMVYPESRLPESQIHPIARKLLNYYPVGNMSRSFYSSTRVNRNNTDNGGAKLDLLARESDTMAFRYAHATGMNINQLSILGADIPGFPVGDDLRTQLASFSETHLFSPRTTNSFRASFFRHYFLLEKRLSGLTPRDFGFKYDPTLAAAAGAPAFLVSGYSNLGDPVIGPRGTVQNNYEVHEAMAHSAGKHNFRFGSEFRRTQVNAVQGLFANGSFTFSQDPTNEPFANLLLGKPAGFTQAGGDFHRALRSWDFAAYFSDEWRASRKLTVNAGLRYEINTPFSELSGKLNSFAPGRRSTVFPDAPAGILFPGDEGVPDTIAPIYKKGWMPRVGIAWDPTGSGATAIRAGYSIFFDVLANGVGGPLRVATQTLPWTKSRQITGRNINFEQPLAGIPDPFALKGFPRPMSIFTIENGLKPPYAQDWNFSIQHSIGAQVLELRYVGTKGTRLPRFVEGNPAVYTPGATAANADRRRIYAGCTSAEGPCTIGHVALVTGSQNSTYHSGQLDLSRRFADGLGYHLSYTFSKTLDYVSSLHLAGPAPILISGENDVAQNPFDLRAEHWPSLFDARHRVVVSGMYEIPFFDQANRFWKGLFAGWQLNSIATFSSATPFTVYDSRNVSLQAMHPPLSGVFASRPDLVSNPNQGPHMPEEWISRSAFRRLDPLTEAGKFGNAGRNVARGAGIRGVDLSMVRTFHATERVRLQFRAECFNVANHANFGLPVNDLASQNFGRILESGPPRLFQFGLKLLY